MNKDYINYDIIKKKWRQIMVYHTLEPIYDENSEILILGSMPSVKSREMGFYYAHPQNRFFKVLSSIYEETLPITKEDKMDFLKRNHIALFDVLKSCEIEGSKDSSIQNIEVNDFEPILKNSKIKKIYTTGKKAYELYEKYCYPKTRIHAIYLPSTSMANSGNYSLEKLIEVYKEKIGGYYE